MKNRLRKMQIHFMVSEEEKEMIKRKMNQIGTQNMGAYLRKMAIDGYIIHLDLSDIRELIKLFSATSNNLNQVAKVANATGHIYQHDIDDLKDKFAKIGKDLNEALTRIASIK